MTGAGDRGSRTDEAGAGGAAPQGSEATADEALSRVAGTDDGGGSSRRNPEEPTTEGESWQPGTHYLAQISVEMGEVTAIDLLVDGFDDEYQEAAALAKVRQLVGHTVRFDALSEPLSEALPADEHGSFSGELTPPAEGHPTGEIRISHARAGADEAEEADADEATAGDSGAGARGTAAG